jgi:hypothetical protein
MEHLPIMMSAIRKVAMAIGGDFEDMKSEAYFLFRKAVENFNPEKGRKFTSYLYKVCWDDTFSSRRIHCHRKAKHPTQAITEKFDIAERAYFDFTSFMQDLSEDSKNAVLFCLNPPPYVKLLHDGTPKRSSMLSAMRKQFSWTAEQIEQVSQEIRDLL